MINITADILYRVYEEANTFNKFIEEALQVEGISGKKMLGEIGGNVSEKTDSINTGIIEIQLV
jgi:hypothetical protein